MSSEAKLEQNVQEWMMNEFLYADDTVLIVHPKENLQRMVYVFGEVCWRRKLKGNVAKSKLMVVSKNWGQGGYPAEWGRMKQVECFRYLGSDIYEYSMVK